MSNTANHPPGASGPDDPTDPSDPADLARRFADLWQSQLTAMANDPALAEGMAATMQVWQQALGGMTTPHPNTNPASGPPVSGPPGSDPMMNWLNAIQAAVSPMTSPEGTGNASTPAAKSDTADAKRPAPPAGASDSSERLLHELDRRFTQLEQRLDKLESALGPDRAGADTRPAKKAAKRSGAKRSGAKK